MHVETKCGCGGRGGSMGKAITWRFSERRLMCVSAAAQDKEHQPNTMSVVTAFQEMVDTA